MIDPEVTPRLGVATHWPLRACNPGTQFLGQWIG